MFIFFCDLPQPIKKILLHLSLSSFVKTSFTVVWKTFNGLLYNTANTTSHVDTSRLLMMHENYSKKKTKKFVLQNRKKYATKSTDMKIIFWHFTELHNTHKKWVVDLKRIDFHAQFLFSLFFIYVIVLVLPQFPQHCTPYQTVF